MEFLHDDLIKQVSLLARQAGAAILSLYQHNDYQNPSKVKIKSDDSPVTEADKLAHEIIAAELSMLNEQYDLPAYIVSEEDESTHQAIHENKRIDAKYIWLVDPLDGTKEFIAHTHEFSVNIALIYEHQPILGVIYVPYYDLLYYAQVGKGAFLQTSNGEIKKLNSAASNRSASEPIRVIASRRHGQAELSSFLPNLGDYQIVHVGSSWKFCKIAEGLADVYVRLGPTSEWDTAAGQIILSEAGGETRDMSDGLLCYNTKLDLSNPPFIAVSQPILYTKICG